MREFTTAVAEAAETDEDRDNGNPFLVDGVECHCYKPEDGQLAVLLASVSRSQNWQTQVAGIINFFVEVLDDQSHQHIVGRLMDRNDPFGLDEVKDIMEWMVEDWTGRPTQPPSVSTRSRPSGGRKSTPRTQKSTSSDSVPAAS